MKKIITIIVLVFSLNIQAQNWEWVKLIQPNDSKSYMQAKVGSNGKVYTAGNFNTAIDFGNSQTLSGNWDGFVAQFDTAGLCQWAQRIYVTTQGCGCTVQGNHSYAQVVTDNSGNAIVYGAFCGCGATFGSGITSANSGYNLFLAKYNSSGVCQWVKTKPSSFNPSTGQTDDIFNAVTIDASDNIYISMFNYATNTVFCGLTFANAGDYLIKVNTNGTGFWKTETDNANVTSSGYGIFSMQYSNKRIYAVASYLGTQAFGTYTFTSQGSVDLAAIKMDTSGNILAASDIAGTGIEQIFSIATSNNRIVLLANTDGNAVTIGTNTLNTNGSKDKTFLVAYDTTSLTVQNYTNTAHDSLGSGSGLYGDAKGSLYLTVQNSGTTGFNNLSSIAAGRHVIRMDNTLTNYWYTQSVGTCVAPDTLGNIFIVDGFNISASYGSSLSETSSGHGITLGKIHNAISLGSGGFRMAQTNTMQVYPNPSGGLFNLQLGTNVKHNNAKITLYDLNGRVIADNIPFTKQDENTLQIDLTKYVEGSYIIKAEVDNVLYSAKLER